MLCTGTGCGGAIVELSKPSGTAHVIVPAAHQSALAGTMLALQLLVGAAPALTALALSRAVSTS